MLLRVMVLLLALVMPATSYLAQSGRFGATIESISNRTPTLIVPAGYAFAIWLPIFVLAAVFGFYQMGNLKRAKSEVDRIRAPVALAFLLTAAWPIVFTAGFYYSAVAVLFASAIALNVGLLRAKPLGATTGAAYWCTWPLLSVMTAWVSMAAFVNLAQTVLIRRVNLGLNELYFSLALLSAVALVLLTVQARIPRNAWYTATAIWALVAIYMKQSGRALSAAHWCAWSALLLAVLLLAHFLWQLRERTPPSEGLSRSQSRSDRSGFR